MLKVTKEEVMFCASKYLYEGLAKQEFNQVAIGSSNDDLLQLK